MKYIVSLLLTIVGIQIVVASDSVTTKKNVTTTTEIRTEAVTIEEKKPVGIESSLEPYGTISWTGVNGESDLGAGLAGVINLYQTGLSIVGFGEGDSEHGILVERLGAGLRYNAYLGRYLSLDAGVSGGYDLEDPHFFLRLPLGVNFTFFRSKNVDAALRVQYAFDISGDTPSRGGSSAGSSSFSRLKNDDCEPSQPSPRSSTSSNERSAIGRLFAGPVLNVKF